MVSASRLCLCIKVLRQNLAHSGPVFVIAHDHVGMVAVLMPGVGSKPLHNMILCVNQHHHDHI